MRFSTTLQNSTDNLWTTKPWIGHNVEWKLNQFVDTTGDPAVNTGHSIRPAGDSQVDHSPEPTTAEHSEAVVRLYSQHQRWLFVYLSTLVCNPDHAEDLMQEVCVVMWKEHHRFKLGTNFAAWLSVIAYHQVQKYWRQKKQKRRYLSDTLVEQLAERVTDNQDGLDSRRQMLRECVSKLQAPDQQLLAAVYNDQGMTVRELSRQLARPEQAVYKSSARIRRLLFDCIRRKMLAEGIEVMR